MSERVIGIIIFISILIIGAVGGIFVYFLKNKRIKKKFNISKGMTYEQIVAALGEPSIKKQKNERLVCSWFRFGGKPCNATIIFENDVVIGIN